MSEIKSREEQLKAQRAYMALWRKKNKDKVQKYNATFWSKQAEKQEQ
jgi:hypothetical protein